MPVLGAGVTAGKGYEVLCAFRNGHFNFRTIASNATRFGDESWVRVAREGELPLHQQHRDVDLVRERTDVRIVPLSSYRRKRPQRSSMKCRVSTIAWQ